MKAYHWISKTTSDTNGWKSRHGAVMHGGSHPIAQAMKAWCEYAEQHKHRFESDIGDDYVLGPAWAKWGFALRALLNGDCGQLDCGTLDTIIHDNLLEQGWNPDTQERTD